MDEIIIEEKKYVSSKQAAKLTGYAKDYVGQLCREGRVPARLVGRSWYVLESAIQDHRFGNPEVEPQEEPKKVEESAALPAKTWEFPRYEAVQSEPLPSLNLLQKDAAEEGVEPAVPNIQDSWAEWFDQVGMKPNVAPVPAVEDPIVEEVEEESQPVSVAEEVPEESVSVPLHVVSSYADIDETVREEISPVREARVPEKRGKGSETLVRSLQVAGALFAVLFLTLAIIGSGLIDSLLISGNQVSVISGVTVVNK